MPKIKMPKTIKGGIKQLIRARKRGLAREKAMKEEKQVLSGKVPKPTRKRVKEIRRSRRK